MLTVAQRAAQREADRRYRERHRDELRAKAKERYASDPRYGPEKQRTWRDAHPDRHREAVSNYKRRNPERNAIECAARRARLVNAPGRFSVVDWLRLKARYGHRCLACGKSEPKILLTPDHVIPLSKGGANDARNIQPLCESCNHKKHTKLVDYR